MSNVHDLFSGSKKKDGDGNDGDSSDDDDEQNKLFVGGIGDRGGGSGLAVLPNTGDGPGGGGGAAGGAAGAGAAGAAANPDSIFQLAAGATAEDRSEVRRTITMYRDGFLVDDGPYRRLDDPANADFLRALAMGRTPRELVEGDAGAADGNVVVGLVDKRSEEYVEEFRSFSGQGTSLGASSTPVASGDTTVFDPSSLAAPPAPAAAAGGTPTTTAIQVRLANGQRRVVRLPLTATVQDLAAHVAADSTGGSRFQLLFGFPPKPLEGTATIDGAGLKGAQVSMKQL